MAAIQLGRTALLIADLTLARYADNSFAFVYERVSGDTTVPVDLTYWTAKSQIRQSAGGPLWLQLDPLIILTDVGGVSFTIPASLTSDSSWDDRTTGAWDLKLISFDQTIIRFVEGVVAVSDGVTRALI